MMICKKVKFLTSKAADIAAAKLQIYSKRDKIPSRSYFCNICSSYHLTSSKTVLQDNNDYLTEKYNKLKSDYEKLLESYTILNKNSKEDLLKIKKDERIVMLNKEIISKGRAIGMVRKDNRELIVENIQLKNKISELLKHNGL